MVKEFSPLARKHLGNLVGFYINEVGTQNLIVHMWAYESYEDRERRRAALMGDPAWEAYRVKNEGHIIHQETRIMRPTGFFEPMLRAMLAAAR